MQPTRQISVILPFYNEEDNVRPVLDGLFAVLDEMDVPSEVIAVDDGSKDTTFERLAAYEHPSLRLIRFRRNFGQTAAITAGFDAAEGDLFVTMDADGQNDPKDIPRLLHEANAGADIVSGWRRDRKDTFVTRRLPSILANGLISRVTGVHLHDYGCTLKAYKREMIQDTHLYGELHRFVPALASWNGAKLKEIEVTHHPRLHGTSKYGLGRTLRVVLDLLTVKFLLSFGTRPIHMFGTVGVAALVPGLAILGYLGFIRMFLNQGIGDRPLLLASVLLILIGLQFISMGLISELLVRIYHESSNKRIYVVAETREPSSRAGTEADDRPRARLADRG